MRRQIVMALYLMSITICLVSFSGFGGAFGVGSSYYGGHPVIVYPGETKTVNVELQNLLGNEDVTVRAILEEGSEVVSIQEGNYFVAFGETKQFPVEVRIPSTVAIGTVYPVKMSFTQTTPRESGGVVLGTAYDVTFDVVVVAQSEVPTMRENFSITALVFGAIIVTVLIILIVILLRKKKLNRVS